MLVLILSESANPAFFDPSVHWSSLVADIVPLFIMALGMTFAIYIGGIDLSVQQVANHGDGDHNGLSGAVRDLASR